MGKKKAGFKESTTKKSKTIRVFCRNINKTLNQNLFNGINNIILY